MRTSPSSTHGDQSAEGVSVLLVDDEQLVRSAYGRVLRRAGFRLSTASGVKAALQCVDNEEFEVIVSDISMPDGSGLDLLRALRERGIEAPVLLITGDPSVETAVSAVNYGARRYLEKPVDAEHLVATVRAAAEPQRPAGNAGATVLRDEVGQSPAVLAEIREEFDLAMRGLQIFFQPIVSWSERIVFAHECLLRSPGSPLPDPGSLLGAAERLSREDEVGRAVRRQAAQRAAELPADAALFVNVHPAELADDDLYSADAPLSHVASQIVLEITERATLGSLDQLRERTSRLREIGFRIAIDDLGAGYAGLSSFVQLDPEIVKIDMSLVRNIHRAVTKRRVVGSLIELCEELKIQVVVEGVETREELDTLVSLGADLLQGYFFARPAPQLPPVRW
jgi:EAL domain-containing protein (putative c-di-GMP-specific phosphodiesterase class I)